MYLRLKVRYHTSDATRLFAIFIVFENKTMNNIDDDPISDDERVLRAYTHGD